jgi:hypothetical protein
VSFCFL